MKKLLITTALGTLIATSPALAEGRHSLTLEGSHINVDQSFSGVDFLGSDDAILPTVRYGYKFQFDDLFVKPSISYTIGDINVQDTDGTSDETKFSNLLTVESDLGYNITEKLGVFGTLGIASINFERAPGTGIVGNTRSSGILFGAGVEYDILDSLSISAKYQASNIGFEVNNSNKDLEVDLSMIKVGVSYNF